MGSGNTTAGTDKERDKGDNGETLDNGDNSDYKGEAKKRRGKREKPKEPNGHRTRSAPPERDRVPRTSKHRSKSEKRRRELQANTTRSEEPRRIKAVARKTAGRMKSKAKETIVIQDESSTNYTGVEGVKVKQEMIELGERMVQTTLEKYTDLSKGGNTQEAITVDDDMMETDENEDDQADTAIQGPEPMLIERSPLPTKKKKERHTTPKRKKDDMERADVARYSPGKKKGAHPIDGNKDKEETSKEVEKRGEDIQSPPGTRRSQNKGKFTPVRHSNTPKARATRPPKSAEGDESKGTKTSGRNEHTTKATPKSTRKEKETENHTKQIDGDNATSRQPNPGNATPTTVRPNTHEEDTPTTKNIPTPKVSNPYLPRKSNGGSTEAQANETPITYKQAATGENQTKLTTHEKIREEHEYLYEVTFDARAFPANPTLRDDAELIQRVLTAICT